MGGGLAGPNGRHDVPSDKYLFCCDHVWIQVRVKYLLQVLGKLE